MPRTCCGGEGRAWHGWNTSLPPRQAGDPTTRGKSPFLFKGYALWLFADSSRVVVALPFSLQVCTLLFFQHNVYNLKNHDGINLLVPLCVTSCLFLFVSKVGDFLVRGYGGRQRKDTEKSDGLKD